MQVYRRLPNGIFRLSMNDSRKKSKVNTKYLLILIRKNSKHNACVHVHTLFDQFVSRPDHVQQISRGAYADMWMRYDNNTLV